MKAGDRFGRLLLIREVEPYCEPSGRKREVWECLCDCGKITNKRKSHLIQSESKSCGCLQKERTSEAKLSHGLTGTRFYRCWRGMKARCCNPESLSYSYYGGRGIEVVDRWKDFKNFYIDMYPTYANNLELDSIDVNGNYCKENCRWVVLDIQAFNKRVCTRNNTGVSGIYFNKKTNKYEVRIVELGVNKRLGQFYLFEDAVKVRYEAELRVYGFSKIDEEILNYCLHYDYKKALED